MNHERRTAPRSGAFFCPCSERPGSGQRAGARILAADMEEAATIADRVNRALNFYLVTMLAVAGAAALPGLRAHRHAGGKMDDSLVVIFALVGLTWYIGMGNRFARRITPFLLVGVAGFIKFVGIVSRGAGPDSPDAALAVFLAGAFAIALGWRMTLRGMTR